ncbi:hypothetical protein VHEMI01030 [[Torrubiella] hemipterigena]|uniref:Fe2OG dioxygenase domain-containing protein n=1 Tax=[Torrubiella] hemipterigena TaxID=1531966 RepID=A0A0A1SRZ8_9HYPO|nr:hypothetical protein VHEMI01030 [[Torrubiella] hemipterigena]
MPQRPSYYLLDSSNHISLFTMTAVSADIPLIDINASDQATVARQLVEGAEKHGFIYIRNLGKDIPVGQINRTFEISAKLFGASIEEKTTCTIQANNRGWSGMHSETLDPSNQKRGDFKEAFNFGEFINGKADQPLPPTIQPDEDDLYTFRESCQALCMKLLGLLGQGLQIGEFFSKAHVTTPGGSATILRLLRYPAPDSTSHSTDDVRAGAHSDYGSITLLFRLKGQAGLEIQKQDNTWAPVPVNPPGTENDPSPPILINIGDLLSYWTNGLFRSTVHRVVFANEAGQTIAGEVNTGPRYSIAFFCHPAGSTQLEAVPSERVANFAPTGVVDNPHAVKSVMTADEHLQMRLRASYGILPDDKKK